MKKALSYVPGVIVAAVLAIVANVVSSAIPSNVIGGSVFALILGMLINPYLSRFAFFLPGLNFTARILLRVAIVLMGSSLSFNQVLEVGKYSLIVMSFTLLAAFGGGYLLGRAFNMEWRLSSLISAGTGICGGSAVAAISPTIKAEARHVAYAISATFIFDVLMVICFPLAGRYFGMSDIGFGLWTGTAVNDTSSVVAAGYAFSDAAGAYSVIVKLTRTLTIIPTVLVFSLIQARSEYKATGTEQRRQKINIARIFPYFILLFLLVVLVKSLGLIPEALSSTLSSISKFLMVMALGAIGLKTNFRELSKSGLKPMLHGFLISALVVVVSFFVQMMMGQL